MKIDGFVIVTIICLMNFSNFNRLIDKIELKFENNFLKIIHLGMIAVQE